VESRREKKPAMGVSASTLGVRTSPSGWRMSWACTTTSPR
jgi:hypothetical protein